MKFIDSSEFSEMSLNQQLSSNKAHYNLFCVRLMLCYIEPSHHKAEQHEGQNGACQQEQSLYSCMSALLELLECTQSTGCLLAISLYMYIQVY